jgi:hypothetical protein
LRLHGLDHVVIERRLLGTTPILLLPPAGHRHQEQVFQAGPLAQPLGHVYEVINRALPDEDFKAALRIAQAEYDRHRPAVVVGSSRGGAVAMNLDSGDTLLVLLCPAWRRWGTTRTVKQNTTILHSRADDVVSFGDSEELVRNSGLPASALVEVGDDHRLADPQPLRKMLEACEGALRSPTP